MSRTSILIAKILAVLLLAVLLTSAALSPRWAARPEDVGAPDRGADANSHTHANAYPGAYGNADPNTDAHARADPDRIYDLYGGRLHACELSAGALLRKLL